MHLVFDLISLNITPFSGLPSLPSYQMYSALCVSAFTRTTTVRPCVVWVVSWTWRDVSQNRRADDHHRKWSVKFVSNQVYVPGEHLGQCTRPCGTQKRPESRFRDIRRESWEAPAREIGDCPGGKAPMYTIYVVWSGDGRRTRCVSHSVTSLGKRLARGVCTSLGRPRTFELRVAATMLMLYKINTVKSDRREMT